MESNTECGTENALQVEHQHECESSTALNKEDWTISMSQSSSPKTVEECGETGQQASASESSLYVEPTTENSNQVPAAVTTEEEDIIKITHSYFRTNNNIEPENPVTDSGRMKPEHSVDSGDLPTVYNEENTSFEISENEVIPEQKLSSMEADANPDHIYSVKSPEVQSMAEVVISMSADESMQSQVSPDVTSKLFNQPEIAPSDDTTCSVTQKNKLGNPKSHNCLILRGKPSQKPGVRLTSLLERLPVIKNKPASSAQTVDKDASSATKLVLKFKTGQIEIPVPRKSPESSVSVQGGEELLIQPGLLSTPSANSSAVQKDHLSHQSEPSSIHQSQPTSTSFFDKYEQIVDGISSCIQRTKPRKTISVKIVKSDELSKSKLLPIPGKQGLPLWTSQQPGTYTTPHDGGTVSKGCQKTSSSEATTVMTPIRPAHMTPVQPAHILTEKGKAIQGFISLGDLGMPVVSNKDTGQISLVGFSTESAPASVHVQTTQVKSQPQISLLQTPTSKHLAFKTVSGVTKSSPAYSLLTTSSSVADPKLTFTKQPTFEVANVTTSNKTSSSFPTVLMQNPTKTSFVPCLGMANTLILAPPYQLAPGTPIIFQPVPHSVVPKTTRVRAQKRPRMKLPQTVNQLLSLKPDIHSVPSISQAACTQPQTSTVFVMPTSSFSTAKTILTISTKNVSKDHGLSDKLDKSKNLAAVDQTSHINATKPVMADSQLNSTPQSPAASTQETCSKLISKMVQKSLLKLGTIPKTCSQPHQSNISIALTTAQSVTSTQSSRTPPLKIISSHDLGQQATPVSDKSAKLTNSSFTISAKDMCKLGLPSTVAVTTSNSSLKPLIIYSTSASTSSPGVLKAVKQHNPQVLKLAMPTTSKAISLLNPSYRTPDVQTSVTPSAHGIGIIASEPHKRKMPTPTGVTPTHKIVTSCDFLEPGTRKVPQGSIFSGANFTKKLDVPAKPKNSLYSATLSTGQGPVSVRVIVPDVDDDSSDTSDIEMARPRHKTADAKIAKPRQKTIDIEISKPRHKATGKEISKSKRKIMDMELAKIRHKATETEIPKLNQASTSQQVLEAKQGTESIVVNADKSSNINISDMKSGIQKPHHTSHKEPEALTWDVTAQLDEESDSDLDICSIEEQDMSVLQQLLMSAKPEVMPGDQTKEACQIQAGKDDKSTRTDSTTHSRSEPGIIHNSFTEDKEKHQLSNNSASFQESLLIDKQYDPDDFDNPDLYITETFSDEYIRKMTEGEITGQNIGEIFEHESITQPISKKTKITAHADESITQPISKKAKIAAHAIGDLPENGIYRQRVRKASKNIIRQTTREISEDKITRNMVRQNPECCISEQTNREIPDQIFEDVCEDNTTDETNNTEDNPCSLKIESIFSLSGNVDIEDMESVTDNNEDQSQLVTLTDEQGQAFNVRESDEWKKSVCPSFVVLERMCKSEIAESKQGDTPSKCSGHCRNRTLNYLCNLGLLKCLNHPDSSVFLKPKKNRTVVKRSPRRSIKHELVITSREETVKESSTSCLSGATALHKDELQSVNDITSISLPPGERLQPSTPAQIDPPWSEESPFLVKEDPKLDNKTTPHLKNIVSSSMEVKEFHMSLEQLQEQVDRMRTIMQNEKMFRKMTGEPAGNHKNKMIRQKHQDVLSAEKMPIVSDSDKKGSLTGSLDSTECKSGEDTSTNKPQAGSEPLAACGFSNKTSVMGKSTEAALPHKNKRKYRKTSPSKNKHSESVHIIKAQSKMRKITPAKSPSNQNKGGAANIVENKPSPMQLLPPEKIKAALDSLNSYLAATGRKPTEGNTQYILLKIEDKHVLVKLQPASSSAAQTNKTALSCIKTLPLKISAVGKSSRGDQVRTDQCGQLNTKTDASIAAASNSNINSTVAAASTSVSSKSTSTVVSGKVSHEKITPKFPKTVSLLDAMSTAARTLPYRTEVSKSHKTIGGMASSMGEIDHAKNFRISHNKITNLSEIPKATSLQAVKTTSIKPGTFLTPMASLQTSNFNVINSTPTELQSHSSKRRNKTPIVARSLITYSSSTDNSKQQVFAVRTESRTSSTSKHNSSSRTTQNPAVREESGHSNISLSRLPPNNALLPERQTNRLSSLTPEERAAKRRRLEAKYPLPPGVVIKSEPDDFEYTSNSQCGDMSSVPTSYILPHDSQLLYGQDQTWSVESFAQSEPHSAPSTDIEHQVPVSSLNPAAKEDVQMSPPLQSQENPLPAKLFESDDESSEEPDEPPALVNETMPDEPSSFLQEDEVIDSQEKTPPILQPMFTSSTSLVNDTGYITESTNPDPFEDNPFNPLPTSSNRSHMNHAPRDSDILTASTSTTSVHSESSLDSGVDTQHPSSSTSCTSVAGTSVSDVPRYKNQNQRILHLKELLRKKEMEIENMKKMRSEFQSHDFDDWDSI